MVASSLSNVSARAMEKVAINATSDRESRRCFIGYLGIMFPGS
jgi:hypothetical protein